MSLTYADDRAVYFDPRRIKPGKCLKCAAPTTRISPRTIGAREGAGLGRMRIRHMSNVLMLCKRCDDRWSLATWVGLTLAFSPLWVPSLMMWAALQHDYLPHSAMAYGMLISFPVAIASYIWARRAFIQVRSIDEDGTIGLGNVHPDTRDEIVRLGEADYLPSKSA